ncbi:hypothetical protein FKM82_027280 [Ascaphus truei]
MYRMVRNSAKRRQNTSMKVSSSAEGTDFIQASCKGVKREHGARDSSGFYGGVNNARALLLCTLGRCACLFGQLLKYRNHILNEGS